MFRTLALLFPAALLAFGSQGDEIRGVLETQSAAWNRGDIPAFMETYAPDTVFVGSEVSRGSAQVKERYLRRYPTRAHMGKLTFSELEIHSVSPGAAYAIGHWHLDRGADAGGPAEGLFSLVLQRRQGRWLIVLDHTH
jgi:uncharacterized protein (TIGR02246 family)